MNTQLQNWQGEFGDSYVERNPFDFEVIAKRKKAFEKILQGHKVKNIFEVGCNVGLNLCALNLLGYSVCGIDPNIIAVSEAKARGLQAEKGDCFCLPYGNEFDLILSCGMLIHIPQKDLHSAITEILRISQKYFLLIEYFAKEETEVNYRGRDNMLWKRNWKEIMREYPVNLKQERQLHQEQGFDNCWCGLYEKLS